MINKITRGYKCRIYPNKEQEQLFKETLQACAYVYNHCLRKTNDRYKYMNLIREYNLETQFQTYQQEYNPKGKPVNIYDFSRSYFNRLVKELKQKQSYLRKYDSTAIRESAFLVKTAFDNYFNKNLKNERPRYKNRRNKLDSFKIMNNNGTCRLEGKHLRLNKYGFIRIHNGEEILGKITDARVKYHNDIWTVTVTCKEVPVETLPKTGKQVGLDLGLKHHVTLNTGEFIDYSKEELEKIDKKIRRLERQQARRLDKKQKGTTGKNFEKTQKKINKLIQKTNNIKKDYQDKQSKKLVIENDIIATETLQINNMKKNKRLSHDIHEAGWGSLVEKLKYKCEWYGKDFVQVDTFYPSSKTCSNCGYVRDKLGLIVRKWTCPECGAVHDRDINAAQNILNEGNRILNENVKMEGK